MRTIDPISISVDTIGHYHTEERPEMAARRSLKNHVFFPHFGAVA